MIKTQRSFNSTLIRSKKPLRTRPKTTARNKTWQGICLDRIGYLVARYDYLVCEYCGEQGIADSDSFRAVWGHHIDGDRNNCTPGNCYICHTHYCPTADKRNLACHDYIGQHHIIVKQEDFQGKDK